MASTYLTRTVSSAGNRKTWTVSLWIKICENDFSDNLGILDRAGGYPDWDIGIDGSNQIRIRSAQAANSVQLDLRSNNVLRDVNAWYHIVFKVDTTQATEANRAKIYLNGEEVSYAISTRPSQNTDLLFNVAETILINRYDNSTPRPCVMSHFHFTDGYAYDASAFGSTDATTGEWKINTNPSVNYGTNGFFILKDGNSVTDQSGNSNNWTVGGGTLTKTEDNPSNVFATLNPLYTFDASLTYTKGNTVVADSGGADSWTTRYAISSLGMMSGKYYAETKISNIGSNQMYVMGIISDPSANVVNSSIGYLSNAYGYYNIDGRIISGASDLQTGIGTATTNDIVGLAFDADNGTMQLYKNGSAIGSQVTGISVGDRTWHFASNFYSTGKIAWNFGNGYFEETAVASAGTNASNLGIFEYDVPSGYTALCTKGLNE